MDMVTIMIIIWSVVIAAALLVEFLTYDLVTTWFAVGAIVALIMAAFGVDWRWQLLTFFIISLLCLIFLRKLIKRLIRVQTTPTNIDATIGKKTKLLSDVVEGHSNIKVNDTFWTVIADEPLKAGTLVKIIEIQGNKFLVKKAVSGETKTAETENKGGKQL